MRTEGGLYKREREGGCSDGPIHQTGHTSWAFYLSVACLLTTGLIWKCHLGFQRGFIYLFISLTGQGSHFLVDIDSLCIDVKIYTRLTR